MNRERFWLFVPRSCSRSCSAKGQQLAGVDRESERLAINAFSFSSAAVSGGIWMESTSYLSSLYVNNQCRCSGVNPKGTCAEDANGCQTGASFVHTVVTRDVMNQDILADAGNSDNAAVVEHSYVDAAKIDGGTANDMARVCAASSEGGAACERLMVRRHSRL